MVAINAVVKDRRLELDVPADWPDGTTVQIQPLEPSANGAQGTMSPDEIRATLAAMDQMEPLEMSDAELAAWEAERKDRKERDKAQFADHAAKLRGMWE